MLVLASGLIVAQLLSAAINLVERDSVLVRASGMQPAQRIADIVTLLDSLSPVERERIVVILNVKNRIGTGAQTAGRERQGFPRSLCDWIQEEWSNCICYRSTTDSARSSSTGIDCH